MNGKKRILVIDDDPDFREALELILTATGYEMIQAGSAAEGLQSLENENPDLILVDLMMEEEDSGIKFIETFRQKDDQTPVFLLSGIGSAEEYMRYGFSGVFTKPVDNNELLGTLRQQL